MTPYVLYHCCHHHPQPFSSPPLSLPSFPPSLLFPIFPSAGSTYTTDTQYGLSGAARDDGATAGPVFFVALHAYVVIDTITCLHREIETEFKKIYGGSGRFEKYAAFKVDSVEQVTEALSFYGDVENLSNPYQIFPQTWLTQLDVDYVKPYLHSSML